MIIQGYSYTQDRQTDEKTYWRCENHKIFNCHYRIHTCNSTRTTTHVTILKQNGNHTISCKRDSVKISLRRFHETVVDRVNNTHESTDTVLSQCILKLSDSARIRLPPLDHVKRTIRNHRKKNDLLQIPNNEDFLCVPMVLQSAKRNENFLRIDTGPGE
jgi:FLYWCH zinc finger domain